MKRNIPLIVGNWKLNPQTLAAAEKLSAGVAKGHKKSEVPYVAIAPTSLHFTDVAKKVKKSTVMMAAQSVSFFDGGAHTGDISATQLKDVGAHFVIVGHSERRADGVSDEDVHKKVLTIFKAKCLPIVCIGEKKRDTNGDFFTHIKKQIQVLCKDLTASQIKKIVIAYEPIWAIGTGKTATADDVKEMQLFIVSVLAKLYDRKTAAAVRLLYGGSVKPHNAEELQREGGMNGFLVGGASLNDKDFLKIIENSQV